MQSFTVILVGRGGELDRQEFKCNPTDLTLATIAATKAGAWIIDAGDLIRVEETEER